MFPVGASDESPAHDVTATRSGRTSGTTRPRSGRLDATTFKRTRWSPGRGVFRLKSDAQASPSLQPVSQSTSAEEVDGWTRPREMPGASCT